MADASRVQVSFEFLYESIFEKFKLGNNADDVKAYLRKSGIDDQTVTLLLKRYFQELSNGQTDDVLTEVSRSEEWYGGSPSGWVKLPQPPGSNSRQSSMKYRLWLFKEL